MSNLTDQIQKLLSEEALQHALSKETLERFLAELKEANARVENLEMDLEKTKTLSQERKVLLDRCREELVGEREAHDKLKKRKAEIEANEFEHRIREIKLYFQQLRVQDHKEIFQLMLRNTTVNKKINSQKPIVINDQYSSTPGAQTVQTQNVDEEITETKE